MIAFYNDPALKEKYQARLAAHLDADDIIRGAYHDGAGNSGWRGCAVGCTLHSTQHEDAEIEIGVPVALMHLDDKIFESLPESDSAQWAVDFLAAIPVGADLSLVSSRFLLWVLSDPQFGSRQYATDAGKAATDTVIALYNRRIAGDEPTQKEWKNTSAAVAAAYAAAYDAAAYAASDAASAAAADAADAAYAASDASDASDVAAAAAAAVGVVIAAADAADAARADFWQAAKTTLLELLATAL